MHLPKLSSLFAIGVTSAMLAINAVPAAFAAGPGDQLRVRGTIEAGDYAGTNATVADAVKSVHGSTVTVIYHGQEKKISIAEGTPIVTLAPATAEDVKAAHGAHSAGQIVVGKNGVVPPMQGS